MRDSKVIADFLAQAVSPIEAKIEAVFPSWARNCLAYELLIDSERVGRVEFDQHAKTLAIVGVPEWISERVVLQLADPEAGPKITKTVQDIKMAYASFKQTWLPLLRAK